MPRVNGGSPGLAQCFADRPTGSSAAYTGCSSMPESVTRGFVGHTGEPIERPASSRLPMIGPSPLRDES